MIWQKVENGKVIDNTAEATSASKKREPGKLDKEDFLNLLVAQMKYQDGAHRGELTGERARRKDRYHASDQPCDG